MLVLLLVLPGPNKFSDPENLKIITVDLDLALDIKNKVGQIGGKKKKKIS